MDCCLEQKKTHPKNKTLLLNFKAQSDELENSTTTTTTSTNTIQDMEWTVDNQSRTESVSTTYYYILTPML